MCDITMFSTCFVLFILIFIVVLVYNRNVWVGVREWIWVCVILWFSDPSSLSMIAESNKLLAFAGLVRFILFLCVTVVNC